MVEQPLPSSSGVRVAGDDFQWLAAWQACLAMRRDAVRSVDNPVIEVGVELTGVGNLDDVVLRRARPPHTYTQVKYAVDASSPVNEEYLLTPSTPGGTGILTKLVEGWRAVRASDGPGAQPELVLTTTRAADPHDELVSGRDSRTQLLVPRAREGGPNSRRGRARARWARAAGVTEAELLELLAVLRLDTGWDPVQLRELAGLRMRVVGLRDDAPAIDAGVGWIAGRVRAGHRIIDRAALEEGIAELGLDAAGPARAAVSVATLKPDPLAGEADVALDWVDRFDGDTDFTKRRPAPPATWAELQADLEDIPRRLPRGLTAVALTGSQRQATGFTLGAALRDVTGIAEVAVVQRGQLWSSAHPYDTVIAPEVTEHPLQRGDDVAVVVTVAAGGPVVGDVLDFLDREQLPVDRLLVCAPPGGARDNAVPDPGFALGLAVGVRDTARRAVVPGARVHLFLVGPLGLAVLMGQRWNRVALTVVYEDVRTQGVYEAAFTVTA